MSLLVRKRKGSVDGSVSDSAASQRKKQPRVSFTTEQKEALRRAYETDPYPTQLSIDRLATELGIGPRTVINWFHNHRMRYAKQQYAATGIWSVTGAVTATKREPSDVSKRCGRVFLRRFAPPLPPPGLETVPTGAGKSSTLPAKDAGCVSLTGVDICMSAAAGDKSQPSSQQL